MGRAAPASGTLSDVAIPRVPARFRPMRRATEQTPLGTVRVVGRHWRRDGLAAGLAVAMALGAPSAAVPADAPRRDPPLGVYRGALAVAGVDAFAQWLGRPTVWAEDNTGSESWNNVADPVWWLSGWSKWVKAKPGRRLVLGIPIVPGPVDGGGPTDGDIDVGKPVSLELGAKGAYDHLYARLAKSLVAHGLSDTILRLGWEFNGDWYAWRAKGKAEAFAAYWRRIVTAMRAVPGTEKLHFCWNPSLGDQSMPAEAAWPGDDVVDSVGLDVYDVSWIADTYPWPDGASAEGIEARRTRTWDEWIDRASHGLRFWVQFARAHKRPLSIPEWGLAEGPDRHGGLDDVRFVERMTQFVTDPANDVSFHCYFDSRAPDGHHELSPGQPGSDGTIFPKAAARFLESFRRKDR